MPPQEIMCIINISITAFIMMQIMTVFAVGAVFTYIFEDHPHAYDNLFGSPFFDRDIGRSSYFRHSDPRC